MSTRYGISLSNITADATAPFREVIRVVSINEHGKLCLPAREIWAKRENEDSDALTYLIFSANEVESAEEGDRNTLDEVNDLMRDISLHSLHPLAANSGWRVTRIMRAASPNIWKVQVKDSVVTYHIIDEKGLLACLKKGDDWNEEVLHDESNWGDADEVDKALSDSSSMSEGGDVDTDDYFGGSELGSDEDEQDNQAAQVVLIDAEDSAVNI